MDNQNEADRREQLIQKYPTILIEGQEVQVRFKLGDTLTLRDKYDIDILAPNLSTLDSVERTLTILSVGISHSIQKTPQELGELFDFGDISYVGEVIEQALKKVSIEAAIPAQQRAQKRAELARAATPTPAIN